MCFFFFFNKIVLCSPDHHSITIRVQKYTHEKKSLLLFSYLKITLCFESNKCVWFHWENCFVQQSYNMISHFISIANYTFSKLIISLCLEKKKFFIHKQFFFFVQITTHIKLVELIQNQPYISPVKLNKRWNYAEIKNETRHDVWKLQQKLSAIMITNKTKLLEVFVVPTIR